MIMSAEKAPEPVHEISLDSTDVQSGRESLLDAIRELSTASSSRPAPCAPAPKQPAAPAKSPEDAMLEELRERACAARCALDVFIKAHPYLIAPNIYRMWEENLTETVVQVERELQRRAERA